MNGLALVVALFGVATGAVGCYFAVRRDWLQATGSLAIPAAALLNMITEGPHSRAEDLAKFAATAILMVIFIAAFAVHRRRARSVSHQRAGRSL
jgi:hypothetical protein